MLFIFISWINYYSVYQKKKKSLLLTFKIKYIIIILETEKKYKSINSKLNYFLCQLSKRYEHF